MQKDFFLYNYSSWANIFVMLLVGYDLNMLLIFINITVGNLAHFLQLFSISAYQIESSMISKDCNKLCMY